MQKLILIKHASPLVDPAKSSELWRLSDAGREKCVPLAERLAVHAPKVIVSSEEPKARETAEIVARHLNVSSNSAPGLHEHDRSNVPHMRSSEFISMMELFFRRPDERVLGRETATAALDRFERAIEDVLDQHSDGNVAIVSHGTVIALYVAKRSGRAAFELWREMGLPSFVVLSRDNWSVHEIVPRI